MLHYLMLCSIRLLDADASVVDTHILLWALGEPTRLDAEMLGLLEDAENEVFFSAVSIWEIAIKAGLGRIEFPHRSGAVARVARETGFVELPVMSSAAERVEDLPLFHRDPFDRILVAQAIDGPMRLYTADPLLKPYSELVVLVG